VVVIRDEDGNISVMQYGVKRRSGRYPYGSGGDETELGAATIFDAELKKLRAQGMSPAKIAKAFDLTTNELRANITISGLILKQNQIFQAERLAKTGMSNIEIGKEMGINESSVRGLLAPQASRKKDQLEDLANKLRQRVDESDGYIDVGKGQEHYLRVSKTKLDVALAMLETEGYVVHTITQPNATTAHDTRVRVLAKPGETWSSIKLNRGKIQSPEIFSPDGGQTFKLVQEPLQLNPARLDIRYKDQGGGDADGMIYIRPGVKDLSMGGASYSQVRIQVGPQHYIKGMAVFKEGLPPGVDVQFNTPKTNTGNKLDALKKVKNSPDPIERFGAVFDQVTDPQTGKVTSHLNKVNDEEDWDKWSKSLATQFLSKQKPDFVRRQLDVTYAQKKAELDEIMALTNPVVKKKLLSDYAENMDAASIHLKAAALPGQKTHVLLAVKSLKDNEVYAPGYKDGERVVLIRYPHGGKFEIPELTVNNRNREARSMIPPTSRAGIGINAKVASVMSGADFDGDTVVLIPNTRGRIQRENPLAKLQGFDPQEEYRGSAGLDKDGKHIPLPGVKLMKNTQTEMGRISNLINDMTIGGANHDELARAVRHSMVVIDAEKHGLNYRKSEDDNAIKALRARYQPGRYGGASTIISRTSRGVRIDDVKRGTFQEKDGGRGPTDPKTGEPIYVPSGKETSKRVVDKVTGEVSYVKVPKQVEVATGSRLPGVTIKDPVTGEKRPVTDAYDLVSGPSSVPKGMRGQLVERHYADYSNKVRDLANQARLAELNTKDPKVNDSAKSVYTNEVASLKAKLKAAQMNSPRERQAQTAAQVVIKMKRDADPTMSPAEIKRMKANEIRKMRVRMGANPQRIDFTPREWEAVQNGAVASGVLREILTKADMDQVRQLAQPKTKLLMQPHNTALAQSLLNSGYTRAEVAQQLGVSVSTLDRSLTEGA
jgi:DNA-binding CsgD family transcriptional regulator